jgi:hypothetical protein
MSEQSDQPPTKQINEEVISCVECGYLLKGLGPTDACPECGLSIRLSRERLHALSSRQFFTVLLRIYAIILFLKPVISEYGLIFNLLYSFFESESYLATAGFDSWFLVLAPTLASGLIAALLWYFAPIIACLAAPINAPLLSNLGGAKTALMIGLVLMAVWFIATGIDSALVIATQYVSGFYEQEHARPGEAIGWLVGDAFRVIGGIFLIGWVIRRWDIKL